MVIICLLWGLVAADSLWYLLLLLSAVTFFKMRKTKDQQKCILQPVELCLLVLGITEAALYFKSTYPANSAQFPLICLTFIFLWFLMRLWIVENNRKRLIFSVLTATGGLLAIVTIIFFVNYWI